MSRLASLSEDALTPVDHYPFIRNVYIHRQTTLLKLFKYPPKTILEYPATATPNPIGHLFSVTAEDTHPKLNMQNSLGDRHGGQNDVTCMLLRDSSDQLVRCHLLSTSCVGLKTCEFNPGQTNNLNPGVSRVPTAEEIVFMKTFGFSCAVQENGCRFDASDLQLDYCGFDSDSDGDSDSGDEAPSSYTYTGRRRNIDKGQLCSGRMVLARDKRGHPRIQCEYYRSKSDTAHLILQNLDEFDIDYLTALITGNTQAIKFHEESAFSKGYGPLVPCSFEASASEQKSLCPFWHRFPNGELRRGEMRKHAGCDVRYYIYTPNDLSACPRILIISKGIHSHAPPPPVKTPPPIINVFSSLLLKLNWKLADATPRKLMIDSGFVDSLRAHLKWDLPADPPLSALHPSLGNYDHARRLVYSLRREYYPDGTDFAGAVRLAQEHAKLPPSRRYVHCAETHAIENGKLMYLVICMSERMAHNLLGAHYITIDTAFKRVYGGYQELEIELWDHIREISVVVLRVYLTSQSAMAHLIVFKRANEIVEQITGRTIRFRHIHGDGLHVWAADAQRGQALGAGMFCQELCRDIDGFCPLEPEKRLRDLNPYDHLKRFYRVCTVHFKRNIRPLISQVPTTVYDAMISIATTDEFDIDGAMELIKKGGRKAAAWARDKESARFVIPGLYQPRSLIPLEIWKASNPTTNRNEQAHRNANRDGTGLTLLGGIMRGMHYDFRVEYSVTLHSEWGIKVRDQSSNYYRRAHTSVSRHILSQRRAQGQSPKKSPQKKKIYDATITTPLPQPSFTPHGIPSLNSASPTSRSGTEGTGSVRRTKAQANQRFIPYPPRR